MSGPVSDLVYKALEEKTHRQATLDSTVVDARLTAKRKVQELCEDVSTLQGEVLDGWGFRTITEDDERFEVILVYRSRDVASIKPMAHLPAIGGLRDLDLVYIKKVLGVGGFAAGPRRLADLPQALASLVLRTVEQYSHKLPLTKEQS